MATKTRQKRSSRVRARSTTDRTTAYAEGVCGGEIIAGPHVRDACARHLRDLEEGPARGLVWDAEAATHVESYFRAVLRLSGGEHEGMPFELHESQAFIIGSLFGWKRTDGMRRFRVAFVETGKGSGKTPLAAGIGHYMTGADGEASAETYAAATDKDQAQVLFRDAVSMAKQSPALSRRITLSGGAGREWNIAYLATGSFFRPVTSESSGKGKSGFRPHCALLDEIHEHSTNAMVEFLRAGTKGRRQPLIFMITNSGVDRTSVCFDYHTYAIRVAAGELEDDSFFSYVCGLDEGEDPFTDPPDPELGYPKSWLKANPLLGVTFKPTYLEEQVRQARGMPSKESIVRRLNFCQWVDAENPWIDGDKWRACEVEGLGVPPGGMLCLDLSASRDITAAGRVVKLSDGSLAAEMRFWTPEETIEERERRDRVPYRAWVKADHLITVPGRTIDYGYVVRDLAKLGWFAEADGLAFDQWNMKYFTPELERAGVDYWEYEGPDKPTGPGLKMVRHGQGHGGGGSDSVLWMPESIRKFAEVVLAGQFKVRKNPVLTWASASAVLAQDATGNQKWEKRKSTGRIDGIVTLSMGVGAVMSDISAPEPEYFIGFIG
jgi:phage terminase large subunit-like protein